MVFDRFKKPRLPAEGRPRLAQDERILAWAAVDNDGFLVATNRGLWLSVDRRLGWHEINKAIWSGRALTVIPGPTIDFPGREDLGLVVEETPVSWTLTVPGQLPRQVHDRVTRSVAYTSHHMLPGQPGGVRVLARRVPGFDGLRWAVRYDQGVDGNDPAVRAATEELVRWASTEV
jgi:hypothetical protein